MTTHMIGNVYENNCRKYNQNMCDIICNFSLCILCRVTVSRGYIRQPRTRYCACSQQLEVCKNYCLTVETASLLIFVFSLVSRRFMTQRPSGEQLQKVQRIQLLDLRHKSQCTNHVVVAEVVQPQGYKQALQISNTFFQQFASEIRQQT